MGMFSWITQDTKKSIPASGSLKVYMYDNKGNRWEESDYEGYGMFGDKDYYQLLAEMNGGKTRDDGIGLDFGGRSDLIYPNPAESPNWKWKNERPKDCPNQGFFYDDEDDDEEL